MPELRVVLNRDHADYERIAPTISKNLHELESVVVTEFKEPTKPGTLTGEWTQVTEFALQYSGELLHLATAVIEMATAVILLRGTKKDNKGTDKPLVVTFNDEELSLPASEQKKKKFLASTSGRTGQKKKDQKKKDVKSKKPKVKKASSRKRR